MVEVTESASQAIKGFLAEKNLASPLRVYLEEGGCCGSSLRLVLDEAKANDETFDVDGLTYLIDKDLSQTTGAVKVDFVDNGREKGFVLSSANPLNGGGSCGGGSCCC
ncbi:MAG: IscA/HesB family protein [Deltaproteobacteria bacterium]|nr:IscA/HesB family protein [Deltaproteobacteria bacterium]